MAFRSDDVTRQSIMTPDHVLRECFPYANVNDFEDTLNKQLNQLWDERFSACKLFKITLSFDAIQWQKCKAYF